MQFIKKTLKSGLRIITVPMPNSLTTTVLVLTETGSKYEAKRINGISHFLEHMCFKGTEKRKTSKVISEELDGLGASYNAFTSHEYTGYYAKAEARHFSKILDVVSDIYLHQTFPEKEIDKERGVIVGEIEMYEDAPQKHIWNLWSDLLYGDQPAGWNIAGTRETVRGLTRDDFVQYKKKHYVASSTVVVVAGNINSKETSAQIIKAFALIPKSKKEGKQKVKEEQKKPKVLLEAKKTSQTHLVLGFRAYDIYHKEYPVLQVLAGVLGGGMSSRLFHKIRDELGAGYYVGAHVDALTDHGYLACFVGVDNKRVHEIVHVILDEIRLLREHTVSSEELEKVKNYLVGNLFSELETSDAIASFYGGTEVLKRFLKRPEEVAKELRTVTSDDIIRVAKAIFSDERLNLALIGATKNDKKITSLLRV